MSEPIIKPEIKEEFDQDDAEYERNLFFQDAVVAELNDYDPEADTASHAIGASKFASTTHYATSPFIC